MNKPKTATLRSQSPPSELLDELHFVDGLLHWVTREELHGEYHHH